MFHLIIRNIVRATVATPALGIFHESLTARIARRFLEDLRSP